MHSHFNFYNKLPWCLSNTFSLEWREEYTAESFSPVTFLLKNTKRIFEKAENDSYVRRKCGNIRRCWQRKGTWILKVTSTRRIPAAGAKNGNAHFFGNIGNIWKSATGRETARALQNDLDSRMKCRRKSTLHTRTLAQMKKIH